MIKQIDALEFPDKFFRQKKQKETPMQGKNVSKICVPVINFFSKTVNEVDKAVKFVKRQSKLTAQLFSETLIAGCLSDDKISLERMCEMLKERNVKITKQGLHQRFNDESKLLMQNLFEKALVEFKTEKSDLIELLKPFSSVKITDSTGTSLPSNLKDLYKGHGGASSEAGIKLQLMFDYLHSQVNKVVITAGCKSDQGFTEYFNDIEKGALYLQDLGYFKISTFANIHQNDAYFVSRHSYLATLLDEKKQKIDLLRCLEESGQVLEKNVFLGKKEEVPVRLVAFRLPDEVVEKRIKKIKRAFQRHAKPPSEEVLKFASWSIYITNTSEKVLNANQVHLIYTIRWQIELFFKLCKSDAGINKISGRSTNRIICEIYAKLICVVQFLYICFPLNWDADHEISFQKAYKSLKTRGRNFFLALKSPHRLFKFIEKYMSDVMDFGMKDRYRKKRKSTYRELMDARALGALA